MHGAGAPSPPSEEGGGTAYKGLKRRDGRRDTPSMCESSKYRRVLNNNDTCITLCMPTPWCKQQPRVLSPSVAPLYPLGAPAPLLKKGSQENGVNAITGRRYNPSVKPLKAERLDSSPYTGEPRSALNLPCTGEPRFALRAPLCVFSIPIFVFRIILCHNPIKMCAHGAHT